MYICRCGEIGKHEWLKIPWYKYRRQNSLQYLNGCRSEGAAYAQAADGDPQSGGIAGYGDKGYIVNCLSTASVYAKKERNSGFENGKSRGAILGCTNQCRMSNCYYNKDGLVSKGLGYAWPNPALGTVEDTCVGYTKNQMKTKSFAKKMGSDFVYTSDDGPHVATIKVYNIQVALKGSKAIVMWKEKDDAENYTVYYRKSNGKYSLLKTTTDAYATLTNINSGSSYSLKIKVNKSDGTSETVKDGTFTFKA